MAGARRSGFGRWERRRGQRSWWLVLGVGRLGWLGWKLRLLHRGGRAGDNAIAMLAVWTQDAMEADQMRSGRWLQGCESAEELAGREAAGGAGGSLFHFN